MMSSRFFFAFVALSAGISVVSCGPKAKLAQQPGTSGQPQTGSAWTLSLKSACIQQEQCVAQYGFSVNADGDYRVGPGPQNQFRTGHLADAEIASIKQKLEAALPSFAALGETSSERHESGIEHVSNDSLSLSQSGAAERVVAHNDSDEYYYSTATLEDARTLHTAIRDLANSYYHLPFGDTCGDAADKITAKAEALNFCQIDSDCVYINAQQGFGVIPPSSMQWLTTEDCSAVKPATVANKIAIIGGAPELVDLYSSAREVCGGEFSQSNLGHACSYEQKPTSTQPACIKNRCESRL